MLFQGRIQRTGGQYQAPGGHFWHKWLTLGSLTLMRAYTEGVWEQNRVLRRISGPKREGLAEGWRRLHNEELHDLCASLNVIRVIKSRGMRCKMGLYFKSDEYPSFKRRWRRGAAPSSGVEPTDKWHSDPLVVAAMKCETGRPDTTSLSCVISEHIVRRTRRNAYHLQTTTQHWNTWKQTVRYRTEHWWLCDRKSLTLAERAVYRSLKAVVFQTIILQNAERCHYLF
jgi:hypothetical protein